MPMHHLGKSIKTFLGSHVDPEKDEELKGTKTEMEDKVQNMSDLIKEEDEDEKDGNRVGKAKKEPRVELIEDFYTHLEKNIQDTSEWLSRLEILEELRNKSADQQRTLEEKKDLIAQVQSREQEVESLQKQKTELEDQNIELEKTIAERVNEISDLRKSYEDNENEASAQIANLTAQVSNLQKEGDSLNAQKAGSELQLERKALEIVQYIDEIENLKEDLACKSREGQKMLEEGEDLKVQVKNLEMEVDSLINQKTNLEDQRVNQTLEIDGLRKEIEGLQERIGELEKTLTVRREELIALLKKHEKVENESTTQIMALTLQLNDKEDAFNKLSEEHRKLELLFQECKENLEVAERKVGETTEEKQNVMKALKLLEEKTEALEKMMSEKDEGISGISEEKREAIRQLCIWIDYHRSRCDDLKEILSKRSGRRPVAT